MAGRSRSAVCPVVCVSAVPTRDQRTFGGRLFSVSVRYARSYFKGRIYLPALLNRKNAGYGVASSGEGSTGEAASPLEGIMRLGALAEGVRKGVLAEGVWKEEVAAERVLSLLRERFEDEGEAGTARGADDIVSGSVLRAALILALRRRARSLCSLKVFLSAPGEAAGSGRGGRTKFEDGMVTVLAADTTGVVLVWRAGTRDDRLAWSELLLAQLQHVHIHMSSRSRSGRGIRSGRSIHASGLRVCVYGTVRSGAVRCGAVQCYVVPCTGRRTEQMGIYI